MNKNTIKKFVTDNFSVFADNEYKYFKEEYSKKYIDANLLDINNDIFNVSNHLTYNMLNNLCTFAIDDLYKKNTKECTMLWNVPPFKCINNSLNIHNINILHLYRDFIGQYKWEKNKSHYKHLSNEYIIYILFIVIRTNYESLNIICEKKQNKNNYYSIYNIMGAILILSKKMMKKLVKKNDEKIDERIDTNNLSFFKKTKDNIHTVLFDIFIYIVFNKKKEAIYEGTKKLKVKVVNNKIEYNETQYEIRLDAYDIPTQSLIHKSYIFVKNDNQLCYGMSNCKLNDVYIDKDNKIYKNINEKRYYYYYYDEKLSNNTPLFLTPFYVNNMYS